MTITAVIWGFLQPRMTNLRVAYKLCFYVYDKPFFVFASTQCFPHFGKSIKFTESKTFVFPICRVLEKLLSHFRTWDIFNPNSSSHSILLQWGICTCCSHTKLLSHTNYTYVWVFSVIITARLYIIMITRKCLIIMEDKDVITTSVCYL